MKKFNILVVEDNRLLREGLTLMLKEQPNFKVVASPGNDDAVRKAKRIKFNVILLDLELRSRNSLRLLESFKKFSPGAGVIGMNLVPIQQDLVQYVKAGVSGFVLKDATFDDLLRTIRSVAQGVNVLPPPLTGSLFSEIVENVTRNKIGNPSAAVRMTRREREVIALIAEGLSNGDIARRLYLSTHTVKSHVHNILEKLSLHTRLEIARFARDDDQLPPRNERTAVNRGAPAGRSLQPSIFHDRFPALQRREGAGTGDHCGLSLSPQALPRLCERSAR
jgi:DNA-binding NarL/FixJ family response regulator